MPWPFTRNSPLSARAPAAESSLSCSSRFAFKLFRELSRQGDAPNLFLSPPSVMLCLALVHELASGETRREMLSALEIRGLDRAGLELEISTLKSAFATRPGAVTSLANSL